MENTIKERLSHAPKRATVSELYEKAYRRAHWAAISGPGPFQEAESSLPAFLEEPPAALSLTDSRHPGRALREDFMRPRNLTSDRLCASTGIAPERLAALLTETEPICEPVAASLAAFFGGHARFWLELQERYEQMSR